jgi:hypothetical protein
MRRTLLALMSFIACTAPALSQTMLGSTTITMIRTGWNADYFAIVTADQNANPANCVINDGYMSAQTLPGYSTYYAIALTAYSLSNPIVITVHNSQCVSDRPMIIGINMGR